MIELVHLRNLLYRVKAGLLYGRNPFAMLRKGLWLHADVHDGLYIVYQKSYPCFSDTDLSHISCERLLDKFRWEDRVWNYQSDTVYVMEDVHIEPSLSLGISQRRRFFAVTKSKAHAHIQPSVRDLYGDLPEHKKLSEAILFDGYASSNHFHFFDDCLNPLLMMLDSGVVPRSIPILFNHSIAQRKWFQYFKNEKRFADLNWQMQQPGEWIFCNRLYRGFSTINWWKAVSENVEVRAPRKNIFIDRLERHGRTLQNRTEVHNVLRKYGFEAVLLDDMSYPEQRELFNNAANVIAFMELD